MKKLIIVLTVAVASCTGQGTTEEQGHEKANEQEKTVHSVPLNNGNKWKADETTKKNVATMVLLINDSNYVSVSKRKQLSANLEERIGTLVKQCSMRGAEHEALHVWLEKVLKDLKELKEENNNEYNETYTALKKDIESFNNFFQ